MAESSSRAPKPPRRHHYVPRFYLERFTDQKQRLSVYDRRSGRSFTTGTRDIAVATDFYRLPDDLGLPPEFLEQLFAAHEGVAADTVREIVSAGVISPDQRRVLASYIALQELRTPQTRDSIGDMASWSGSLLAQIEIRKRIDSGEFATDEDRSRAEAAIESLAQGKVTVRPTDESLVGLSLSALEKVTTELLGNWAWSLVLLSKPMLLTSDQPVAMLGEPELDSPGTSVGVGNALEIWLPLDPRHAVVASRDMSIPKTLLGLTDSHVKKLNLRIALQSDRHVFYRPGTAALKGLQIPTEPPRWFSETVGRRENGDGTVGELVITGITRPHVPNEHLLSGRPLRPFRTPRIDGIGR